jgi:dihydrofolate synthase/folylpolyglutamate synthase
VELRGAPIVSHSTSLQAWLARLEQLHPSAIELGLERARRVWQAMALVPRFPIVIVGGTNGKGSTCAILDAIFRAAGYRTGLYTSPHLLRYNERVRVDGREASDAELVTAFAQVDAARGDTTLTYFEFGTLGAMAQFVAAAVDVAILEVGLGGRLDAVNLFDADVALVTGVDLDHQDYLGPTREAIGLEKAGIYRAGRPAICADPAPPASLVAHACDMGADLRMLGQEFSYDTAGTGWTWHGDGLVWRHLPKPALAGGFQLRNAAAALAAAAALRGRLPVAAAAIDAGLRTATAPGRFQRIASAPETIVDVAHNPEAARALARTLREQPARGRLFAVLGMLADKDADGVVAALAEAVDRWWVCTPDSSRALSAAALAQTVRSHAPAAAVNVEPAPRRALATARGEAREDDRIVVFGSFYTVAAVLDHAAPTQ